MSVLERLRERLHQKTGHHDNDGDNTTDTLPESVKLSTETTDYTGCSADFTDHKLWIQKIKENGNKPEDWLVLLGVIKKSMLCTSGKKYATCMCMWYAKAVNAINLDEHKDSAEFARLLVEFANIKSHFSLDEASSFLHSARRNLKRQAIVHVAAAQLELSRGNQLKARQILEKALELEAKPVDLLRQSLENLNAGKTILHVDQENEPPLVEGLSNEQAVPNVADTSLCTSLKGKMTKAGHSTDLTSRQQPACVARKEISEPSHAEKQSKSQHKSDVMAGHANIDQKHPRLSGSADSAVKEGYSQRDSNTLKTSEAKCGILASNVHKTTTAYHSKELASRMTYGTQLKSQDESTSAVSSETRDKHSSGMSIDDSTVTFRRSKTRYSLHNTELDDGETIPVPLDREKGVYKHALASYNSTPDCKGLGFMSGRKRLGKPQRVKRTSLPQFSSDNEYSDFQLDSLAEMDVPATELSNDRNVPVQSLNAASMDNKGDDSNRRADSDADRPYFQEDNEADSSPKHDGDSGIITSAPEETPPSLSRSNLHTLEESIGSTASTTKATVLHNNVANKGLDRCFVSHSLKTSASSVPVMSKHLYQTTAAGQDQGQTLERQVAASAAVIAPSGMVLSGESVQPVASSSSSGMLHSAGTSQQVFQPTRSRPRETVTVCGKVYTILRVLGRGGSSEVYDTIDPSYSLRAVKCVDLKHADEATIKSYLNEIKLLKRLQHSNKVIKLFDYEYVQGDEVLYVVLERGDTDLAALFRQCSRTGGLDTLMQKFYWKEMLKAVQVLHNEGIVHSDLKPANFLLVAGSLKLIDFGIAKALHQDVTSITCEQAVGTLNYMSPEAIMDSCGGTTRDEDGRIVAKIRIGTKSDVWSLGCILYNMVYGKSPFHHITNSLLKLQAITNPNVEISFPKTADPVLREVLIKCLQRDPKRRPSIKELLEYNY